MARRIPSWRKISSVFQIAPFCESACCTYLLNSRRLTRACTRREPLLYFAPRSSAHRVAVHAGEAETLDVTMQQCERCGGTWHDLPDLAPDVAGRVSDHTRAGASILAIQELRSAGVALHDSKAVVQHWATGACHRCNAELPIGLSTCSRCRSVNYNFPFPARDG